LINISCRENDQEAAGGFCVEELFRSTQEGLGAKGENDSKVVVVVAARAEYLEAG
jgi:hypothetical protein